MGDPSELVSIDEFLNILIDISRSYTTINDMITHSLKMKQDTCVDSSDSSAIHLLDASISLQLYLKMKKTKDQDKINIAKEIFEQVVNKI
tara:strand:+ start:197 stop:466 length:270 start_codon:yes stop_codon:yes gene_type:complete